VFQLYCFIVHNCISIPDHPYSNSFEPITKTTCGDVKICARDCGRKPKQTRNSDQERRMNEATATTHKIPD
jgi:hypothetical protein